MNRRLSQSIGFALSGIVTLIVVAPILIVIGIIVARGLGAISWEFFTESCVIDARSSSGIDVKKSQRARSATRCSTAGCMLIALRLTWVLSLAGQTSTQMPQPVQSSGATWIVSWCPSSSRDRNVLVGNPSGAPPSAAGS